MKAHEFLAEADSTKSYEIKRGDTLSKIARDNSTTVNAIMDLNRDNRAIRDSLEKADVVVPININVKISIRVVVAYSVVVLRLGFKR